MYECPIYRAVDYKGAEVNVHLYRVKIADGDYLWNVDADTNISGDSVGGGRMGYANLASTYTGCCPPDGTPIVMWVTNVGHVSNSVLRRADAVSGKGFPLGQIRYGQYFDANEDTVLNAPTVHECAHRQLNLDKYASGVLHNRSTLKCYSRRGGGIPLTQNDDYDAILFEQPSVLAGTPKVTKMLKVWKGTFERNAVDCAKKVVDTYYSSASTFTEYPDGYYFDRKTTDCFATFDTGVPYTVSDTIDEIFGFITPNMFGDNPPITATTTTKLETTLTTTVTTAPESTGTSSSANNYIIIGAGCIGGVLFLTAGVYVYKRLKPSQKRPSSAHQQYHDDAQLYEEAYDTQLPAAQYPAAQQIASGYRGYGHY